MSRTTTGRKTTGRGHRAMRAVLLASAAWLALGFPAQAFLESTDGAGGQNGLGAAGGNAGFGNGGGGGGNTLAGQNGSASAGGSGGGNSINEQGGLGGTESAGGTGSTNAGDGGGVNQAGSNSPSDGGLGGAVGQGGGGGTAQYYGGGGGGGGTGGGGGGGGTQNPLAGGGGGGFRGYYGSASSFNPVGETQILGAGGGGGGGSTGGGGGGAGVVLSEGAFTGTLQSGLTIAGGGGGGGGSTATGSGGWGGNGGTGLLLQSLDASSFTISGTVSGGNGGNGGYGGSSSSYSGGSGGAGARGIGVEGNTQTVALIVNGTVTGGNGGTAGTGYTNGSAGAGGSGIWGQNIAVTVNSTGSVSGGLGGDGVTRADALTFTGGTNTLTLETGATLTGGIVVATNATTLEFAQATDVTLSNAMSGDGSVSKTSAGTLFLTGANTYSGGTYVNTGTLAGTTTSLQGDIVNNASLVFDQATNGVYSGALSGSGSLTKTGTGSVTLTASNSSYTGAVTIDAGTLALSGAGSLANASGVTIGKGTFDISATTSGATIKNLSSSDSEARVVLGSQTLSVTTANLDTFAGVISGNGGLTVSGILPNGLILTGDNTYLGTTTVNGALLIGFNSASGSVAGDIVVNAGGGVAFGRNDTYTIQNSITAAAGSLIAFAYGTYSYAGSGVISGAVLVQGGELHLIANEFANASSLTLDTGGTLSGNGTVGNLIVKNGGIVAPGNSPGNLAVNGTVAFHAGSTYRVDVTPTGEHDLLTATGAVTISGGTVQIEAVPGDYAANSRYAILTAGSVTGTFTGVTENYAFLDGALSYDPTNVFLTLTYTGASFATYARTPNQLGTAVAAQALGDGNAIYDALLLLPENAVPAAFDALSGEAYASVSSVLQQQSIYVRDAVSGRLRQALTAPGVSALAYGPGPVKAPLAEGYAPTLWAQGYGGWGNTNGNGNAATISNTIGGFLMGADVSVAENARAGLFGGYSRSTFDVDGRSSSGSANNVDLGLYAGAQFGAVALRGGAAYTWHDLSMSRSVVFPGFAESLKGSDTTGTAQVFGEIGYDVEVGAIAFEPFLGLAYVNVSGASLGEEGGAAALSVSTDDMSTFYSTLGVRLATTVEVGGRTLTPYATLGWQHAFGDVTPTASNQFAGGLTPFSVSGVPVAEDALLVEAGLSYALSPNAQIGATYAGQLAGDASQNAFTAQFSLRF